MNAFSDAMADIMADQNTGVDIVYRPDAGDAIECRGVYDEQQVEISLQGAGKINDASRLLLVRVRDIPAPVTGSAVEIAGVTYRLFNFTASDPQDGCWRFELTTS